MLPNVCEFPDARSAPVNSPDVSKISDTPEYRELMSLARGVGKEVSRLLQDAYLENATDGSENEFAFRHVSQGEKQFSLYVGVDPDGAVISRDVHMESPKGVFTNVIAGSRNFLHLSSAQSTFELSNGVLNTGDLKDMHHGLPILADIHAQLERMERGKAMLCILNVRDEIRRAWAAKDLC